jgi:hypothetical protein
MCKSEEIDEGSSLLLRLRKHRILPNQKETNNPSKQKRLAAKRKNRSAIAATADDSPMLATKFSKLDGTVGNQD